MNNASRSWGHGLITSLLCTQMLIRCGSHCLHLTFAPLNRLKLPAPAYLTACILLSREAVETTWRNLDSSGCIEAATTISGALKDTQYTLSSHQW